MKWLDVKLQINVSDQMIDLELCKFDFKLVKSLVVFFSKGSISVKIKYIYVYIKPFFYDQMKKRVNIFIFT